MSWAKENDEKILEDSYEVEIRKNRLTSWYTAGDYKWSDDGDGGLVTKLCLTLATPWIPSQ